jgi:hypothetical protein
MESVYVVFKINNEDDSECILGIFDSKEEAEKISEEYMNDYIVLNVDCYPRIEEYILNKIENC